MPVSTPVIYYFPPRRAHWAEGRNAPLCFETAQYASLLRPTPHSPPVHVLHLFPHARQFLDDRMLGREMAHRIGGAGVAGEREGLAAAAAEVLVAARAACARLLQPVGPAEGAERGRGGPDVGE